MKRILVLLTVALVMAAMMALSAGAAFGQEPRLCMPNTVAPLGFVLHGAEHACAAHPPE